MSQTFAHAIYEVQWCNGEDAAIMVIYTTGVVGVAISKRIRLIRITKKIFIIIYLIIEFSGNGKSLLLYIKLGYVCPQSRLMAGKDEP